MSTNTPANIDQFAMVLDFHRKFACKIGERPGFPDDTTAALRCNMIAEEFKELKDAIAAGDLVEVADALADILYVVHGNAISFGIDIRPVFAEVHRTNMAKQGGATRPDGKVMKPPGWQPPNLAPLLEGMNLTATAAKRALTIRPELEEANRRLHKAKAASPVVRVRLDSPGSMFHKEVSTLGEFDGERWETSYGSCVGGLYYATSLTVVTEEGKA